MNRFCAVSENRKWSKRKWNWKFAKVLGCRFECCSTDSGNRKWILSDFNLFTLQVFVAALITSSLAEPPALSHSYGLPEISSGYSYEPSSHSSSHASSHSHTDYEEQHVGHQTSEGLHLDQHLLHKIEGVLVQHENSNKHISAPSHSYGAPQSAYGVPSYHQHWQPSVVGIDFGHLRQSIPVAEYLGRERYAQSHGWNAGQASGWVAGNSGWNAGNSGWNAGNSGWTSGSSGWVAPAKASGWQQSSGWIQPTITSHIVSSPGWSLTAPAKPAAWTIAKPAGKYGVPRY